MFLYFLIAFMAYFAVGTVLARRDYANRMAAAGTRDAAAELASKYKEIKAIRHTSSCWRGPTYRSTDRDCDCPSPNRVKWHRLNAEITELESGEIPLTGPYPMLFAWPVKGFDAFLRGGTSKTKALRPKTWEQKMEQELLDLDP